MTLIESGAAQAAPQRTTARNGETAYAEMAQQCLLNFPAKQREELQSPDIFALVGADLTGGYWRSVVTTLKAHGHHELAWWVDNETPYGLDRSRTE